MQLIKRWNHEIIRKINKMDEQVLTPGILNNRAEHRFTEVINSFKRTFKDKYIMLCKEFCSCKFKVSGLKYDLPIKCSYELKNMLLGRNYDLRIEIDVPLDMITGIVPEIDAFDIDVKYKGVLKPNGAKFNVNKGGIFAKKLSDNLNIQFILDRIFRLNALALFVRYNSGEKKISILIESLKGSSTWCLIPPIFQLIPLKEQDCIDIVEISQLMAHAIKKTIINK